jgi:hypothetical protein
MVDPVSVEFTVIVEPIRVFRVSVVNDNPFIKFNVLTVIVDALIVLPDNVE